MIQKKIWIVTMLCISLLTACSDESEFKLIIADSEYTLDASGNDEVMVSFDVDIDWGATSDKEWINIYPNKGEKGKNRITIKANKNLSSTNRVANIAINYGDKTHNLNIIQEKNNQILLKTRSQLFINQEGGNVIIELEAGISDPQITIPEGAKQWLNVNTIGETEIILTARANPEQFRKTNISISNQDRTSTTDIFVAQLDTNIQDLHNCYYVEGGDIGNIIPNYADTLFLFGNLNKEDFMYLRNSVPKLTVLDLKGTIITEIPDNAFYHSNYEKYAFTTVSFPSTLKRIGKNAFRACYNLRGNLTLPNSIEEISDYAFYDCPLLSGALNLPSEIKSIGDFAFDGCVGFTGDMVIPNSLTKLGTSAFGIPGMKGNIIFEDGIKHIPNKIFSFARHFQGNLILPNSVTSIGEAAFNYCTNISGELQLPQNIIEVAPFAFEACYNLTGNLTFPSGLSKIGYASFRSCRGFDGTLYLPNTLTTIEADAFSNCSNLTGSLVIPQKIKELNLNIFADCYNLTGDLIIPEGVTTIGPNAFINCSGFGDQLIIPSSVNSIGYQAFSGCTNITSVFLHVATPFEIPVGETLGVWNNTHPNKKLYVPNGSLDAYRNMECWAKAFNNGENIFEF